MKLKALSRRTATEVIMGDYAWINGVQYKIGTCGDNRYMRRDEALALLPFDEGDEIRGNLEYEAALWRFPFPQEDGAGLEAIGKRNMFDTQTFTAPPELLPSEHEPICVHVKAQDTLAYGVNRLLPCPLSKEDRVYGQNVPSPIVQIYGERCNKKGQGRTIFRCGYCGKPFSINAEELPKYQEAFINNWNHLRTDPSNLEWAKMVANRFQDNKAAE